MGLLEKESRHKRGHCQVTSRTAYRWMDRSGDKGNISPLGQGIKGLSVSSHRQRQHPPSRVL